MNINECFNDLLEASPVNMGDVTSTWQKTMKKTKDAAIASKILKQDFGFRAVKHSVSGKLVKVKDKHGHWLKVTKLAKSQDEE